MKARPLTKLSETSYSNSASVPQVRLGYTDASIAAYVAKHVDDSDDEETAGSGNEATKAGHIGDTTNEMLTEVECEDQPESFDTDQGPLPSQAAE